jgi:hypothetical protein
MANPEHLAILKQGIEVWKKWRSENPGIKPDLSGADLLNAELFGADLHDANPQMNYKRLINQPSREKRTSCSQPHSYAIGCLTYL